MKVTFIFNNINWTSASDKIAAVKNFFQPDFDFEIDVKNSNFKNIPYVQVSTINGIQNTLGTTNTVDQTWYDRYITVLSPDSDIIVFVIAPADLPPHQTSVGIMQGKIGDVVQTCIFGINETDHAYVFDPKTGIDVDQGNCFVVFVCHEISHALYLLEQAKVDNTHLYFYSGKSTDILPELKSGVAPWYQTLILKYQKWIGMYEQQITVIKSQTMNTDYQQYTKYPKIYQWAKAIAPAEGARPDLNNPGDLKVTPTTETWGATNGFEAEDGGWIAKFPDLKTGFQAQVNLLTLIAANEALKYHLDRTLQGVMTVYANHPKQEYINQIAAQIGVPITIDVGTFLI